MKVLLINGSPHKSGCTYTALSEAAKVLNAEGIDTEIICKQAGLDAGVKPPELEPHPLTNFIR